MDGFKKRIKGGTSEFGIKVPSIPRRCHLRTWSSKSILVMTITEENIQKRQSQMICLLPSQNILDLLLKELLPPVSCQSNQPRPEKEHGGGFGDDFHIQLCK